MLINIEVARGIYIAKFFFFIYISPGNLPRKGILSINRNNIPAIKIISPVTINIFPKG